MRAVPCPGHGGAGLNRTRVRGILSHLAKTGGEATERKRLQLPKGATLGRAREL